MTVYVLAIWLFALDVCVGEKALFRLLLVVCPSVWIWLGSAAAPHTWLRRDVWPPPARDLRSMASQPSVLSEAGPTGPRRLIVHRQIPRCLSRAADVFAD